jgi:carbon monoxide dehydrogenase subunit G
VRITQEFTVDRPVDAVWEFFGDVPEVARCLPGAELTEDLGDGTYSGRLEAKLGPMAVAFDGKATVTRDEAATSGHIDGSGADRRGGSRGRVKVDYALAETDGGTKVTVDADVTLSGPAAQFGRVGLIKEMSSRLIGDFVSCLESKLDAGTAEEAQAIEAGDVKGASLFFGSLWAQVVAFFKRVFGRSDEL